ncbi:hypothetical protein [Sphingomonas sp. NIBR02145]|uniref:hypothetical protein n=1 Tax=Sphingomonas sp. NIBR02145 TaxID=3014784 RepID=UPI0022B2C575|nr:hypothetical protein [Sphingomonas sp. NIBR02145]WHU04284.1 hypothetical protein O3305_06770 [Sphingomonas sp. NIBR02145]
MIAIAFWPGYWGQLSRAPFALHAHGITATAWLILLTMQSWAITARKFAWHRASGLATFIVLPLFAAAGPLALQGMAVLWSTRADPFHSAYGSRLVIADMIAGPSVVILVVYAFLHRRRVEAHASAMLATALLVLPPIIGRLFPAVPGFPHGGWAGFAGFRLAFQLAEAITLIIALSLASRSRAARFGFVFAAAATAAQMIAFETIGTISIWDQWVTLLVGLPAAPMSLAAGAVAAALLIWAWKKVPTRSDDGLEAHPAV